MLNANTLTLPMLVRDKEGGILMCLLDDSHVHHLVAKQVFADLKRWPHTQGDLISNAKVFPLVHEERERVNFFAPYATLCKLYASDVSNLYRKGVPLDRNTVVHSFNWSILMSPRL